MIEIPAAAIVADLLAREVEFFSIGTKRPDPVLARDRPGQRACLLSLRAASPRDPSADPAVVEAGHDAGIPVSMCGEMAGEPFYSYALLGLGLDELSMNAAAIRGEADPPQVGGVRGQGVHGFAAAARDRGRDRPRLRKKVEDLFPDERF